MFDHADEERLHMLKLIRYVNERGGHASMVLNLDAPLDDAAIEKVRQVAHVNVARLIGF